MKRNFIYASFLAGSLLMSACEMDTFNEQDAIAAQKELLTLKYQNETELEKLRMAATTALEQLKHTNALENLRLNFQLQRESEEAEARQDYTLRIVDVNTNTPLADADVTVASEGKVVTAKTNAAGIASFEDLILFDQSRFSITKAGFTAASITRNALFNNPSVGLLNIAEAKNEVKGTLFIETDLTNSTPEVVPENTLVTATTEIPGGRDNGGNTIAYTMQVATRTTAGGNYSLKLPDAPNGYNLDFGQVAADQKLYVNGIEGNGLTSNSGFPTVLPQVATVKTYFHVNNSPLSIVNINSSQRFYFKLPADLNGKVGYFMANGVGAEATGTGNEYKLNDLAVTTSPTVAGNATLKFAANDTIDVELVDWTGKYVKNAPKIVVYTEANGTLRYVPSISTRYDAANTTTGNPATRSYGFLHFKRENITATNPNGNTVAGAPGLFKMPVASNPNIINNGVTVFNFTSTPVNTFNSVLVRPRNGEVVVRNFYYGLGASREKQVF